MPLPILTTTDPCQTTAGSSAATNFRDLAQRNGIEVDGGLDDEAVEKLVAPRYMTFISWQGKLKRSTVNKADALKSGLYRPEIRVPRSSWSPPTAQALMALHFELGTRSMFLPQKKKGKDPTRSPKPKRPKDRTNMMTRYWIPFLHAFEPDDGSAQKFRQLPASLWLRGVDAMDKTVYPCLDTSSCRDSILKLFELEDRTASDAFNYMDVSLLKGFSSSDLWHDSIAFGVAEQSRLKSFTDSRPIISYLL